MSGTMFKTVTSTAAGAPVQVTTLSNGLRVVSHDMPHLETVSLGIWVACGARHEAPRDNGISHFLEHMAFKGTGKRSARAIAEEIEQVGGDLNAATSLDNTAYYARVLKNDLGLALELLSDILLDPLYLEVEIEREREVILQEIAATKDSPDDIVYDLMQALAYPGQSVGRPILGTEASVRSFTSTDLRRFLAAHYAPNRMVISAAGGVDHGKLVKQAEALFGRLNSGAAGAFEAARYAGGYGCTDKAFEQSHVVMGFEGPGFLNQDFYPALVFSGLFGGGMSSRLFQEVRERRGLCYSIYSTCWGLSDTGVFSIHAATGPESTVELVDVISSELERAAGEAPSAREVERSKAQLKAGLLMSLESSASRAEQMARHMLAYGHLLGTDEIIDRVEAVTPGALQEMAGSLVAGAPPALAVVGEGAARQTFRLPGGAGVAGPQPATGTAG